MIAPLVGRSLMFPLKDSNIENREPVFIFDWNSVPIHSRTELMDSLFGDCSEDDYQDITIIDEDGNRVFRENWVPFAMLMVDSDAARNWYMSQDKLSWPQFSQLLIVNTNEVSGKYTPLYVLNIDGTIVPQENVSKYNKIWGELNLVDLI